VRSQSVCDGVTDEKADRPDFQNDPTTGEPLISLEATALLFGVTVDELRAHLQPQADGTTTVALFPAAWIQRGQQNTARAQVHGHTAIADVLAFLRAERDAR